MMMAVFCCGVHNATITTHLVSLTEPYKQPRYYMTLYYSANMFTAIHSVRDIYLYTTLNNTLVV